MGRRWRTFLLGSLLVLAGLVGLLLATPLLLDTERYRGMLVGRASRVLNREVTAQSLRIHLVPRPGATIRRLMIADRAPWSAPFVEADRMDVSLKFLPLLKGEVQVRRIQIDRPKIRLARGLDGWNLEDLIRPGGRATPAESRRPEGAKPGKGQPALPILLAGALTIRDGTLVFETAGQDHGQARLELRGLNVDVPAPAPQQPLRIQVSGHLPGEASGSFVLTGSARVEDPDHLPIEAQWKVRGLEAAALASHLGLSGSTKAAISGSIDLEGTAAGEWPRLDVQADIDFQRLGLTFGKDVNKAPGEKVRLRAKGRWDGATLDLPDMRLDRQAQTITGRLYLENLNAPKVRFEVTAHDLAVEPVVAMVSALGSSTSPPSTRRTSHPAPRTSHLSESSSRTEWSTGVQIEGRLRSGALHWGDLILRPAEGELRYAGGFLTLRRLRAGLYGGNVSGEATIDWRQQPSRVSISARLEGVQAEPLLKALHGDGWTMRGVMTLDSKLNLSGQPAPGMLASASGQSEMLVTGGRIVGYPPLDRLSQTLDPILKGVGISSTLGEFDRLSAHWTIQNGKLQTRDLTLQREGARLLAAGSLDLQDQKLDFDVTAKVAKATLEAKVSGTPSNPAVTVQLGRIEQRIKTEVGKALKGERGEALGKMLRQFLPR